MKGVLKYISPILLAACITASGNQMPLSQAEGINEEIQIQPRMEYISMYGTELSISSSGLASVTGFVRGKSGVSSAYVKVTLQKSVSGKWVNVKSWEDSSSSRSATVAKTYQVSRGTYRTVATLKANTESKTAVSANRTY